VAVAYAIIAGFLFGLSRLPAEATALKPVTQIIPTAPPELATR
jgi:hypothetical protein